MSVRDGSEAVCRFILRLLLIYKIPPLRLRLGGGKVLEAVFIIGGCRMDGDFSRQTGRFFAAILVYDRGKWRRLAGKGPARRRAALVNTGFYCRMIVPVFPAMPSLAFSSRVMRASRPGLDSANFTAASTLGSMEPGANCPWPA